MNANWLWLILPAFLLGAAYEYWVLDAKDPNWGKDYRDGYNDGYLSGSQPAPDVSYVWETLGIVVALGTLFMLLGFVLKSFQRVKKDG